MSDHSGNNWSTMFKFSTPNSQQSFQVYSDNENVADSIIDKLSQLWYMFFEILNVSTAMEK